MKETVDSEKMTQPRHAIFFGILVIWIGMQSAFAGVTTFVETWDSTSSGWVDRDPGKMVVDHSAAVGAPEGSLQGQFASQGGVPVPETDAFRATVASSGGGFTGNYWEHYSVFYGWSFDFRAADVLPSMLQVRFGGAGSVFFANVLPQVSSVGGWYSVTTPTTHAGGWFGGTVAQWSNALAAVEWVEVQVVRNGEGEQTYYLDNFDNNLPVIRTSAIGDRVWYDADADGLQNAGETFSVKNLPVALMDATSNAVLATTVTDANGNYLFTGLASSNYVVRFDVSGESSLAPSPLDAGSDDAVDSDAATNASSSAFAWTQPIAIGVAATNLTVDLGLAPKDGTRAVLAEVWGEWANGEARLSWHAESEWGTAGYFAYGVDPETGIETRLSERLVPSKSEEGAAIYTVADPVAREGEERTYRIEEVELTGRVRDLGTHAAQFGAEPAVAQAARAAARTAAPASQVVAKAAVSGGMADVLKVAVEADGIYGVCLQGIADGLGCTVESVRALAANGDLAISARGRPVPAIYDAANDRLVFHGEAPEPNGISRKAAYLISKGPGLAMPRRTPGAASGATTFPMEVRFEQNLYLGNAALPTMPEDGYYWYSIVSSTNALGGRRTFPLDLAGFAGGDLQLMIRLMGWSNTTNDPDHRAEFRFNGTPVGSIDFDGQATVTASVTVPASLVIDGANALVVKGVLMSGRSHSQFAVDWIDAAFARRLEPRAETAHFRVGGAAAVSAAAFAEPLAFSLDETGAPTWIADEAGSLPAKAWAAAATNERFAAVERASIPALVPEAAAGNAWFLASSNRIDYLVIAPRALAAAAQELADYRSGQGLRVGLAIFEDVCDLLADGARTPRAISNLLAYAQTVWSESPWMVVLAGNGHYDYLGLSATKSDHLPPLMYQTREGICAADSLLGDMDGDGLPDVAVGRLPAQTTEDLAAMIAKIKTYEAGFGSAWENQLVFVSDATDTGNDFAAANAQIEALVAEPYAVVARIALNEMSVSAASDRLAECFRNGAGFVHFTGHGGVENLGAANLLDAAGVAALNNGERPTVLMALSCLAGRFEEPATESLGESLMRQADGGAVAVLGPSGLSRNAPATELGAAFYRAVLQEGAGTVGQAFLKARRSLPSSGYAFDTLAVYNLLGDPALRIAGNVGGAADAHFAQWRWQNYAPAELADSEIGGTAASFLRYALGDDGILGLAPASDDDGSGFILQWQRRVNRADVEYRLYLSEDLRKWVAQAEEELPTVGVETNADGIMETVRTRIDRTNAAKLFMGIRAVRK